MKSPDHQTCLPCVIQVGFAGTRHLSLTTEQSQVVVQLLCNALQELPQDLGLQPFHFICGISALAIGGDSLFTEACSRLNIPQRIFLPQPRDVFLEATGSDRSDFTVAQKVEAERLLALPHIIQERVVSNSSNRTDRFADTNREINRVSDIVVCLTLLNRTPLPAKPSGTRDLLDIARVSGKPVLELKLDLDQSEPQLNKEWCIPERNQQLSWIPPMLPEEVARLPVSKVFSKNPLPTVTEYCNAMKTHCDAQAGKQRTLFRTAAWIIVGTHILATFLATLVLAMHGAHSVDAGDTVRIVEHRKRARHEGPESLLIGLLAVELLSLGCGFLTHRRLNHSGVRHPNSVSEQSHRDGLTHAWGMSRLLAEVNRSVTSLGDLHIHLEYLFQLALPRRFRQLLCTINVLHLVTTSKSSRQWNEVKDAYVVERIDDQLSYFQDRSKFTATRLKWAKFAFLTFSLAAMCFTAVKLTILAFMWSSVANTGYLMEVLGTLAVILPSAAVAVMSLAAAHDYEAQNHIYLEMALWLPNQKRHISQATSQQEFQQLVQETELRILGETVEWYSRRSFTGIA